MKVKGVWARQRKKSEQASQSLKNSQTSLNDNAYYQRIIFFFFFFIPNVWSIYPLFFIASYRPHSANLQAISQSIVYRYDIRSIVQMNERFQLNSSIVYSCRL